MGTTGDGVGGGMTGPDAVEVSGWPGRVVSDAPVEPPGDVVGLSVSSGPTPPESDGDGSRVGESLGVAVGDGHVSDTTWRRLGVGLGVGRHGVGLGVGLEVGARGRRQRALGVAVGTVGSGLAVAVGVGVA